MAAPARESFAASPPTRPPANGLAMDIKRHLKHEPVVARAPTAAYRFQKAWKTLVSGDKQGDVLVWDMSLDPERHSSWTLTKDLWEWHFSSDNKTIYAVEQTLEHFSNSLQSTRRQPTLGRGLGAFARDPGRLLRFRGPLFERVEVIHEVEFTGEFAFSPSGRLLAGSLTNGVLRVWDLDKRIRTAQFPTGARILRPVTFSRDETRVWLLQEDGQEAGGAVLTEWDLRRGRP